jgi:RAD51-like protein 1
VARYSHAPCLLPLFLARLSQQLVGPAGVGKTQLALTLTALAPLPCALGGLGEDSGVIYVDTEGKFNPTRLIEIAQAKAPSFFAPEANDGDGANLGRDRVMRLIANVQVYTVRSSAELLDILQKLRSVMPAHCTRLVVVDSVAALARQEFGADTLIARQDLLAQQAALLKSLAEDFGVPVVVTNQVTTRFARDAADEGALGPALGNTWAHCVNTRLVLMPQRAEPGGSGEGRVLSIAKSPLAGPCETVYCIGPSGLESIEGEPAVAPRSERIDARGQAGISMGSCMASGAALGTSNWQQQHSKAEARPGES